MKKDTSNPNIALIDKFLQKEDRDKSCYVIGGRVRDIKRPNILLIGQYHQLEHIGGILTELKNFGGATIFTENYGANRWMSSGQIDLIIGYDLEAGEVDWLGKCYDKARKAKVPVCVEFLVGRECEDYGDFEEKFKLFMKSEFYKQKNQMEQPASTERLRKLTDQEIGWRGKEFISSLKLSQQLAARLHEIGITDPKRPLKGTIKDLVQNFIMLSDNQPMFSEKGNEGWKSELRFILEQLGYLPRPAIEREGLQTPLHGSTVSDEVIAAVLEKSSKQYGSSIKIFFDKKFVTLEKGTRPDSGEPNSSVHMFYTKRIKELLTGKYSITDWFDNGSPFSKSYGTKPEPSAKYTRDSIVTTYFPGNYHYLNSVTDRILVELLILIEEKEAIPNFAYEALVGGLYGKESKIPLRQIS